MAATAPCAVGRMRRISLERLLSDAARNGFASTSARLIRQPGAETLGSLLRDFELGYSRRLAVVIPSGPVWPLRGHELALIFTQGARGMGLEIETSLVTPERSPLVTLGDEAVAAVSDALREAGVAVVFANQVEVEPGQPAVLVPHPSGTRVDVDRVIAPPTLRGRSIPGVPVEEHGFVEIDEHCRVKGLEHVWAIGDVSTFPVKSGGMASEEADVAAEAIAGAAGADVESRAFDRGRRGELAGPRPADTSNPGLEQT